MSTFRASVSVEGDTLTTSRPLTAPEPVGDLIDSAVYQMTDGGAVAAGVTSIELVVDVEGESETPIGDSVSGTSSQPLTSADVDDEAVAGSGA
jgi:hypothetical protein